MGVRTRGRGRALSLNALPDGYGVLIPTAELLLPRGRQINRGGLEPDIVVDEADAAYVLSHSLLGTEADPQFVAAMRAIEGRLG